MIKCIHKEQWGNEYDISTDTIELTDDTTTTDVNDNIFLMNVIYICFI